MTHILSLHADDDLAKKCKGCDHEFGTGDRINPLVIKKKRLYYCDPCFSALAAIVDTLELVKKDELSA